MATCGKARSDKWFQDKASYPPKEQDHWHWQETINRRTVYALWIPLKRVSFWACLSHVHLRGLPRWNGWNQAAEVGVGRKRPESALCHLANSKDGRKLADYLTAVAVVDMFSCFSHQPRHDFLHIHFLEHRLQVSVPLLWIVPCKKAELRTFPWYDCPLYKALWWGEVHGKKWWKNEGASRKSRSWFSSLVFLAIFGLRSDGIWHI